MRDVLAIDRVALSTAAPQFYSQSKWIENGEKERESELIRIFFWNFISKEIYSLKNPMIFSFSFLTQSSDTTTPTSAPIKMQPTQISTVGSPVNTIWIPSPSSCLIRVTSMPTIRINAAVLREERREEMRGWKRPKVRGNDPKIVQKKTTPKLNKSNFSLQVSIPSSPLPVHDDGRVREPFLSVAFEIAKVSWIWELVVRLHIHTAQKTCGDGGHHRGELPCQRQEVLRFHFSFSLKRDCQIRHQWCQW